jgi:hypothetical protein
MADSRYVLSTFDLECLLPGVGYRIPETLGNGIRNTSIPDTRMLPTQY